MKKLECAGCGKDMGHIVTGKWRENMVLYCAPCDVNIKSRLLELVQIKNKMLKSPPGFLEGFFNGN